MGSTSHSIDGFKIHGNKNRKISEIHLRCLNLPKNAIFGKGSCKLVVFKSGDIEMENFCCDLNTQKWSTGKIFNTELLEYKSDVHHLNPFVPESFRVKFEVISI